MAHINWTHTDISIKDISRRGDFYEFFISTPDVELADSLLKVKAEIFDARLTTGLIPCDIQSILSNKWDFYITKGHYIKINQDGTVKQIDKNPDVYYVSYFQRHSDKFDLMSTLRVKQTNI